MDLVPIYFAAGGLCAASGVFAWGSVAPSAQLFGPTIRRTADAKTMALTFDDGPNPAITPGLLNLLDRHHAKATFFLVGKYVRAFPALAKEIAGRGHTLGNHTETHPNLIFLSPRAIAGELDRCDEAISAATGERPRWMRPPYGYRGPQLQRVLEQRGGTRMVMWSMTGRDWNVQPREEMIERLRRAQGGDIVLLHDGNHRLPESDRRHTVAALEHWLPRWRDQGIRFMSLDEMTAKEQAA